MYCVGHHLWHVMYMYVYTCMIHMLLVALHLYTGTKYMYLSICPTHTVISDVISQIVTHYLVKWKSLPYEDATWELEVRTVHVHMCTK